jgi:hypothetical protein
LPDPALAGGYSLAFAVAAASVAAAALLAVKALRDGSSPANSAPQRAPAKTRSDK